MSAPQTMEELRLRTGIEELDALLGGGIRIPEKTSGVVAVVSGEAGAGKTTLVTQLLASFLAGSDKGVPRPTLGAYWSIDHPAKPQVAEGLRRYELASSDFAVQNISGTNDALRLPKSGKNLLVVRDRPVYPRTAGKLVPGQVSDVERLISFTRDRYDAIRKSFKFVVFVLDSLSSFGDISREDLQALIYPSRESTDTRFLTILVDESAPQDRQRAAPEYFLADIVIRLGTGFMRSRQYRERFIEIEKMRYQYHVRGRHQIGIRDGRGIVIYPSLAGRLGQSLARGDEQRQSERAGTQLSTGIPELDEILGGEGLPEGSATLLSGPPSTRKTPISLHFLATTLGRQAAGQKRTLKPDTGLLILLRHRPNSLIHFIQQYKALQPLEASFDACTRVLDQIRQVQRDLKTTDGTSARHKLQRQSETLHRQLARDAQVQHRSLPSLFDTPSVLLGRISQWVEGTGCRRLVVDDLTPLLHSFPLAREQADTFLSVLLAYLRSRRVTSLFIQVLPDHPKQAEEPSAAVASHFDNLIWFSWKELLGVEKLAMQVRASIGGRHNRGLWEVTRSNGALKLRPSFEGFTKLQQPVPEPVDISLKFYSETSLQRAYHDHQVQVIRGTFGEERVRSDPFEPSSAADVYRSFLLKPSAPTPVAAVTMVDEYWVCELAKRGSLLDLSKMARKRLERTGVRGEFVKAAEHKARHNGAMYALPYFVNMGLFCWRKDLLATAGIRRPPATWYEVLEMADRVLGAHPQEKLVKFDFDRRAQESYSAMLLELLFNSRTDAREKIVGAVRAGRQIVLGKDVRLADRRGTAFVDALFVMRRLISPESLAEPGPCSPNAIFSRHWFTTLAELLDQHRELMGKIEAGPLPAAKRGVGGGRSLAGEWYLAIPAGAACPEIAWHVLDDLSAPEMDVERFRHGVGLPAQVRSYRLLSRKSSAHCCTEPQQLRRLHERSLTRLAIAHYREICDYLASRFQEILSRPRIESPKAETAWLFDFLKDVDQALEGVD